MSNEKVSTSKSSASKPSEHQVQAQAKPSAKPTEQDDFAQVREKVKELVGTLPKKGLRDFLKSMMPKGEKRARLTVTLAGTGFPVTSLLRWMGAQGWAWREAFRCLVLKHDCWVSELTVKSQIAAGQQLAEGNESARGELIVLTEAQIDALKNGSKK